MSFFFRQSANRQDGGHKPTIHRDANVGAGRTRNIVRPTIASPFNEWGTIIGVNAKLLYGVILGVVAWWLWPANPKWWGLGVWAVILWASSFALIINAIRSIMKLRSGKKRWKALQAMGNSPKNARLADKHDLQSGGMN